MFVHLIDVSEAVTNDPVQSFKEINDELEMYDKVNARKRVFFPFQRGRKLWCLVKLIHFLRRN